MSRPGEVEVTANVDFVALWEAVNRRVSLEESLEHRLRSKGPVRKSGTGGDATDKVIVNGGR